MGRYVAVGGFFLRQFGHRAYSIRDFRIRIPFAAVHAFEGTAGSAGRPSVAGSSLNLREMTRDYSGRACSVCC
jgi:hypothetical protein